MSEENVEKIKALLEPFDDAEITGIDWDGEAIREILGRGHARHRAEDAGVGYCAVRSFYGLGGLIRYFREWFEPFSEYRMKWLDYVEAGERVLVPIRRSGVGSGSGLRVEMELVLSFELQDSLITRLDQYDTLEQALEAAGLSE